MNGQERRRGSVRHAGTKQAAAALGPAEGPGPDAQVRVVGDLSGESVEASLAAAEHVAPVQAADRLGRGPGGRARVLAVNRPHRHWVDSLPPLDKHGHPDHRASAGPAATVAADAPAALPVGADAFTALLAERRSELSPGSPPLQVLVDILHLLGCARAESLDDIGRVWQSRAHPSAGGTHAHEPLIHAENVPGLRSGWYRQEGSRNGDIARVDVPGASALLAAAGTATRSDYVTKNGHLPDSGGGASVVLFAIADPVVITARYPGAASLLWRDAGAFLTVAHLLATSYRVTSTIVGLCCPLLEPDTGPVPYATGALALGGPVTMHGSHNGREPEAS